MASIIHEITATERAEKFVGRTELREQIYEHCTADNVENNTMILTGLPGTGKTSLMAYVATKCVENMRPNGDFIFLHVVDSCVGSNTLQNMLKRLHLNLNKYIGEEKQLKTTTDLKTLHVSQLEEAAKINPDKKFVIFVDAVNQFSSSMQSHTMWWLPSRRAPKNLRVIISTLICTGDTLENALKRCPQAVIVKMPVEMPEDDCKEMVSAMLKQHNMEITTENNDPRVGNQMEKLLNKKKSPLYLRTAVEGMRTKWIMATDVPLSEAHTVYIENLPGTTEELFEFLMFSWEGDFGPQLIRWLLTIIALSREGLKRQLLTDLLAYVKESYPIKFEYSVNTILDFIQGFLSCEGTDYIRFFHEVISSVVLERYDRKDFVPEVRDILVQFSLKHIKVQRSNELERASLYYEDCLSHIVYHQTEIRKFAQDWNRIIPQISNYNDTLKNIFFIKERIFFGQKMELMNDFRDTADINMEDNERISITEWERFTQFYWQYIKQYPQWSYAFAKNQPNKTSVATETRALSTSNISLTDETFPLTWLNKPDEVHQKDKVVRCVREKSRSCCASSIEQNLLGFGCDWKAYICDQTTGDVLQQVQFYGSAMTVHFSPNGETFWVGNNWGKIYVWSTQTGEKEQEELEIGEGHVLLIKHVSDTSVVCGTGGSLSNLKRATIGIIALIDTTTHLITKTWSTQRLCWSYCYHAGEGVVVSGHSKEIICWNVRDGSKVNVFNVSNERFTHTVRDMCAHNELPIIVFVIDTPFAGEITILNTITGECNTIVRECGHYIAQFDHTGDSILCTSMNEKTIEIYDLSGILLNTIRIHGGYVRNISSLPYPSSFVSAGDDGGKSHIASTTPLVENTAQVVTWCELLPNNKEFVTLSEEGEVSVFDCSPLHLRASVVVKFSTAGRRAAVHPSGEFILVCTWKEMCVVNLYNVEIVCICRQPEYEDAIIRCAQFTPSGHKCVVLTSRHGTHVYKVHSMHMFEHLLTFTEEKDRMSWCDVTERQCVSGGSGGSGIVLWDIDTGETLKVLRTEQSCRYVKFLNHLPRGILYHIWESALEGKKDQMCIMDMNGHDMKLFDTKVNHMYPKLHIFDNYMITAESDGSIRLHDMFTEEILYVFVDEQSLGFNAFMDNPVTKTITCYNGNARCYTFEKTFV